MLVEEGFDVVREHEIESIFTVSNGYVGTRGSLAEGISLSNPATLISGVFDDVAVPGSVPELASGPDWTHTSFEVDGRSIHPEHGDNLEHRRILDLRSGLLWRCWRFRDAQGRVSRIRFLRLASLADRRVLFHSVVFSPENYSGGLKVRMALVPAPDRPDRLELVAEPAEPLPEASRPLLLRLSALNEPVRVAVTARTQSEGLEQTAPEEWKGRIDRGQSARLDRVVVVATSRESPDPVQAAVDHLQRAVPDDGDEIVSAHRQAWDRRWLESDVEIDGNDDSQRALRFAIYHLIGATHPEDEHVSVGARALTGTHYKGHVFWDTEMFVLPFFCLTHPPTARSLLMYRYHTLPAARAKARQSGFDGALFAWESATNGEDATPPLALSPDGQIIRIVSGEQEHHISADVAYAAWQYWEASGDDEFFASAGAEILLETAAFWKSRSERGDDGRYHIRRIMGPDEYHEGVDDNAYTNGMARWNLQRGVDAAEWLRERHRDRWDELARRLGLTDETLREWQTISNALATGFDPSTKLLEQFRGFFKLEEVSVRDYEPRTLPLDSLLGRERVLRTQIVKQADVLMLIYLLWDDYPPPVREANFRTYEPRTDHGSSLSPPIHAAYAARLGDVATAWRYFQQTAGIDLSNNMGNAAGGVHIGALGGLWQAAVFGFAGVQFSSESIDLEPHLPPAWSSMRFPLLWRGRRLVVRIEPTLAQVKSESEATVPIRLGGKPVTLGSGQTVRWIRADADAAWEKETP